MYTICKSSCASLSLCPHLQDFHRYRPFVYCLRDSSPLPSVAARLLPSDPIHHAMCLCDTSLPFAPSCLVAAPNVPNSLMTCWSTSVQSSVGSTALYRSPAPSCGYLVVLAVRVLVCRAVCSCKMTNSRPPFSEPSRARSGQHADWQSGEFRSRPPTPCDRKLITVYVVAESMHPTCKHLSQVTNPTERCSPWSRLQLPPSRSGRESI